MRSTSSGPLAISTLPASWPCA
eukprot:gene18548-25055_t